MNTRSLCLLLASTSIAIGPVRASTIYLGGTITTAGGQTYASPVILTNNTILTSTGGGDITFSSTVDGGYTLAINTGGATTFGGAVGSGAPLASLTTGSGGTTAINGGGVTTSGNQTYNGMVILGADTTLFGNGVTFGTTVDGSWALTVNAPGVTTFSGAVGNGIPLDSLTTDVLGTTAINGGGVTTSGSQTYNDAVTLGANATLTGTAVTFGGTVNGASRLTVNASSETTFSGAVGNGIPLDSLTTDVLGTTAINGGGVTTIGNQTYNNAVTLGANATLTGTAVTFGGTVNGASRLTVNASGATTFGGQVGDTAPLTSLATDAPGTTVLSGGAVTTSGAQSYSDAVTLGADTTLLASAVTFGSTVNGPSALTVNVPGTTTFGGAVGNSTPLASLTTDVAGTTAISGGTVTTSGNQTYSDPVTLGANVTLSGSAVTLDNTVDGTWALALNVSGTTKFSGAVGNSAALASLTTDVLGTTAINGGGVTTSGSQTYNDAVTLGANTTLTETALQLAAVIGNNRNLTLNNSGPGTLNGPVSGVNYLAANGSGLLVVNNTVSAGSISVNPGATLGGNGVIIAPVSVLSGGTVSPGTSIGSLTVSDSLALFGTAFLELNKSNRTNDLVQGMTSIVYGGTLSVYNLGGTLAAGDAFKLFDAAAYVGTFRDLNLPALANGLIWDTSNLPSTGLIKVVNSPSSRITSIVVAGLHTVQLTGTGHANQAYYVRASTNATLPMPQWWLLGSTNATPGGIIHFADTLATNYSRFYRLAQ